MDGVDNSGYDEENGYDGEDGQFFVDWLVQDLFFAGGPDSDELEEVVDKASHVDDLYAN